MKKVVSFLLSLIMLGAMASCGNKPSGDSGNSGEQNKPTAQVDKELEKLNLEKKYVLF